MSDLTTDPNSDSNAALFYLPAVDNTQQPNGDLDAETLAALAVLPACDAQLPVLYEDRDLVIVNKPARLLSVPGRHPDNYDSVLARLQAHYGPLHLAHRLDFDTSGILVVPRTAKALSHITQQFQARSVDKTYVAEVAGVMATDAGEINLAIARDTGPRYKICADTGKPSLTEYRVISRELTGDTTRVALHPITGRTHQLRLHLQALGHPILGCEFYGGAAQTRAPRLCLHARELAFTHPHRGERLIFSCEPDF